MRMPVCILYYIQCIRAYKPVYFSRNAPYVVSNIFISMSLSQHVCMCVYVRVLSCILFSTSICSFTTRTKQHIFLTLKNMSRNYGFYNNRIHVLCIHVFVHDNELPHMCVYACVYIIVHSCMCISIIMHFIFDLYMYLFMVMNYHMCASMRVCIL